MSKSQKDIREVVAKQLPEFASECQELGVDGLEARLVQNAKDWETTQDAENDDEELEKAKSTASELGAPYRDAKKVLRMKRRFLIALIKDLS